MGRYVYNGMLGVLPRSPEGFFRGRAQGQESSCFSVIKRCVACVCRCQILNPEKESTYVERRVFEGMPQGESRVHAGVAHAPGRPLRERVHGHKGEALP